MSEGQCRLIEKVKHGGIPLSIYIRLIAKNLNLKHKSCLDVSKTWIKPLRKLISNFSEPNLLHVHDLEMEIGIQGNDK